MNLSCYTIDDLRLGYDPEGSAGWRQSRFLDWRDALEQYQSLPDSNVKTFGLSSGEQEIELVRHLPVKAGVVLLEDVLVLDFLALPLWKKEEDVTCLARELVSELDIRYCLAADRLVPAPKGKPSSNWLEGKYLWPDIPNVPESAIRWLYLASVGWVSPSELKRRFSAPEQNFRYPVITKYKVDGVTENGAFIPLELTYWEYKLLERRTQERLDHKKNQKK